MSNIRTRNLDGDFASRPRATIGGIPLGTTLAFVIATLAGAALGIEGTVSLRQSLGDGHALPEALFLFLRYFTILTNLAVAVLMAVTVVRRHGRLPPDGLYVAVTVYAIVTGVAYEVLLRGLWSPHGMRFDTDLTMHDIVPSLTVLFWILYAPKRGPRWRDAAWLLVFPIGYFAVTLIAGALGEDYPYDFLDVSSLGYTAVLGIATMFLAVFYGLGLLLIGLARILTARGDARG